MVKHLERHYTLEVAHHSLTNFEESILRHHAIQGSREDFFCKDIERRLCTMILRYRKRARYQSIFDKVKKFLPEDQPLNLLQPLFERLVALNKKSHDESTLESEESNEYSGESGDQAIPSHDQPVQSLLAQNSFCFLYQLRELATTTTNLVAWFIITCK
eukprot:Protomagalhaensia_wolfi_Nauph_80__653@NODE_1370_length_1562_cov_25_055811_g1006_i1_p1_GENE_NODE_1370_length_1562_cov_25_055811_g1006_i1NODE_1370_length_1562_cov_25_055811_g1006_i1_p1_ORF_typecomplete_len159_score13_06LeukA4hydro_C/PF09127_11/0_29LeukA4hydro_C/PF09127_11/1e04_NODE_1370_length_1562_cov_25_055811_g1006_i1245721